MAAYRCPAPCDPDCEVNDWGCHEAHDVPSHREHDPGACEARILASALHELLDSGRSVALGKNLSSDPVEPWYVVVFGEGGGFASGVSLGDVVTYALRKQKDAGAPSGTA